MRQELEIEPGVRKAIVQGIPDETAREIDVARLREADFGHVVWSVDFSRDVTLVSFSRVPHPGQEGEVLSGEVRYGTDGEMQTPVHARRIGFIYNHRG